MESSLTNCSVPTVYPWRLLPNNPGTSSTPLGACPVCGCTRSADLRKHHTLTRQTSTVKPQYLPSMVIGSPRAGFASYTPFIFISPSLAAVSWATLPLSSSTFCVSLFRLWLGGRSLRSSFPSEMAAFCKTHPRVYLTSPFKAMTTHKHYNRSILQQSKLLRHSRYSRNIYRTVRRCVVSGFDGLMDFINDVARNVVETEHLTLRNENIRRGFFWKVKVFRFTPSCIKKSFQFTTQLSLKTGRQRAEFKAKQIHTKSFIFGKHVNALFSLHSLLQWCL